VTRTNGNRASVKARRREQRPAKVNLIDQDSTAGERLARSQPVALPPLLRSSPSAWARNLGEAVQAARGVLLGPVVGDLSYDMEVTRRYRQAAEIVNDWRGLSHRERIALNRSLPWEQAVALVWEVKHPRTSQSRKADS